MSNAGGFEVPTWAGKPPPGLHLDVTKDTKMIQKLMVDEKKCYLFGRNNKLCDFAIDHASCSRVHACLVWHKNLNRPFLIDNGSTHGTYIGRIRLESKKPTQVLIDSTISFGASTRAYIIRERPQGAGGTVTGPSDSEINESELEGGLLGLPETETELDNLTEFNTAHNRRIAQLVDLSHEPPAQQRQVMTRKRSRVLFNEEEDIINPEDVDPSIGRFRNLIQTAVIPNKKQKMLMSGAVTVSSMASTDSKMRRKLSAGEADLYDDLPDVHNSSMPQPAGLIFSTMSKLGLSVPNPAPEVDMEDNPFVTPLVPPGGVRVDGSLGPAMIGPEMEAESGLGPKKKKYAKEAWPGKKPALPSLLV